LKMNNQMCALHARPDIVVATPGRMIDHLRNSLGVHLDHLEILVLDEADRLLDMGFVDEINEIVRTLPSDRQTMLFSATVSRGVTALSEVALRNAVSVKVDLGGNVVDALDQEFILVKGNLLGKDEAIILHLCRSRFRSRTMIFGETKRHVHRLKILFELLDMTATELTGNLTQLQRLTHLEKFKNGEVNFLVCTDVASRGLDIKGVRAVINLKIPDTKTYIHRVGRTARAGLRGVAVTLCADSDRGMMRAVMSLTKAKKRIKYGEVDAAKVQKVHEEILNETGAYKAVCSQEFLEETMEVVKKKEEYMNNVTKHHAEIMSRPKKHWFITKEEAANIKHRSKRARFKTPEKPKKLTKEELERKEQREETFKELKAARGAKIAARNEKRRLEKLAKGDPYNTPVPVKEAPKKRSDIFRQREYKTEYKSDRIGDLGKRLARKWPSKKPFVPKKKKMKKRYKRH